MLTRKSHWLYIYLHIRCFRLPVVMPLYVFWEVFDAVEDMFLLFGRFAGVNPPKVMRAIAETVLSLTALGRFDLVDVETKSGNEKVKVRICLR